MEDTTTTTTTNMTSHEYCGEWWENLLAPHRSMYVYLIVVICVLGTLTNILNLLIFTRKSMQNNPTHKILMALAATDLLLMILGVEEFVYHKILDLYGMKGDPQTYAKVLVFLLHEVLFVVFHTWSIYLTLTIAIWRYIAVYHPTSGVRWGTGNDKSAKFAILSALTIGIILALPYTAAIIRPKTSGDSKNFPGDTESGPEYEIDWEKWQEDARDWINAILIKILPCILMTVVSIYLVLALKRNKRDRKKMMAVAAADDTTIGTSMENLNGKVAADENETDKGEKGDDNKDEENLKLKPENNDTMMAGQIEFDRVTKMLLLILLIFIQTEFPPGLFSLLSAILGTKFREECEWPALGMLNMQAYISGAINFFVYLVYSAKFHKVFVQGLRLSMPKRLRIYLSNFRGFGWCLPNKLEDEESTVMQATTVVVSS